MISNIELVLRLLLSALAGGSIGIEREVSNRPAGLRTHILVSVGSTLIMLVSVYGFNGYGDPARLAAQVVSGVGFLGAGTIMRTGNSIKGLTTAASLWVCSGIGLAIGAGYYLGGIVTAAIVLLSLVSLQTVEQRVNKSSFKNIQIEAYERAGLIGEIGTLLGKYYIIIKDISISEGIESESEEQITINLQVKTPNNLKADMLIKEIYELDRVTNVIFDGKMITGKDKLN